MVLSLDSSCNTNQIIGSLSYGTWVNLQLPHVIMYMAMKMVHDMRTKTVRGSSNEKKKKKKERAGQEQY